MFDRKSIKEFARFRLKSAHWLVVAVVLIASLLGGAAADVGSASFNFEVNLPTDSTSVEGFDLGDWLGDWFGTGEADPEIWDDAQPEADPDVWDDGGIQANPDLWGEDSVDNLPQNWEEWKEWFRRPSLGDGVGATRMDWGLVILFLVIFFIVMLFVCGITIFLGNIVTVGIRGWLLRYWRGETPSILALFDSFRIYKPSLKAMLWRDIATFLWSLLFIIPGIIKSFAYSMVPYIIYENPNLSANQALRLSNKLTKGAKGKLFVLGLSFLGWNLLSALTMGLLGVLYVNPYMGLTYAGVYEQLKWDALQSGRVDWADFGQAPPMDIWDTPVADTPAADVWVNPTAVSDPYPAE